MSVSEIPRREPRPDLIATLEDLLDQARRGDLIAIAVATEHVGRSIGHAYCGDIDLYRILGAIESLKRRIMDNEDA